VALPVHPYPESSTESNMELNHRLHGNDEPIHKSEKGRTEHSNGEVRRLQGLDVCGTASVVLPCCRRLTRVQRYIPFLPTIAFDATLQSSWEALSVSFQAGLFNGGPVCNLLAYHLHDNSSQSPRRP